ncbi:biotin--[acetyl-CoA-carboxylase] ligase [Nonlabens antarcticus]|uniref:biotin--[acetyl-CoA-carboxylase] ligase n=1 Tax=Nonlabens antarcticus TaxID=392714 RepID=UPI001891069E|nr:biotin--[acetyl-CoA-carboxylase] ligase [Nonlabens antarcticus]
MSFKLVKLHATGSTNDDLKVRFRESELTQLTTIYTDHQTAGRGQMGAKWVSEPYKNLTFSTLLTVSVAGLSDFEINKFVTVALVEWLRKKLHVHAVIKWPNDILSVNHKLAGLLIENIYKGSTRECSIVGIGLNVNQTDFQSFAKAISLCQITGKKYDLEELLIDFLTLLKTELKHPEKTIARYESYLFKFMQTSIFRKNGIEFTAIVSGTDNLGKLLLDHNGTLHSYDLKEVEWVY